MKSRITGALLAAIALGAAACASQSRMGMVQDPATGLQFGSVVEKNIFVDPSQFKNRRIKVTVRNTSGDPALEMNEFRSRIVSAFASKGYEPHDGDDFGIRLDLNVMRSSQIQESYAKEFGFLGAAAGGLAGLRADQRASTTGIGILSGATLGSIIGSHITDDTYIIIAEVRIGITDRRIATSDKTIIFSSSDSKPEREQADFKPFVRQGGTHVAVFAGGRNVAQPQIAEQVRQRLFRIVSDII